MTDNPVSVAATKADRLVEALLRGDVERARELVDEIDEFLEEVED